MSFNTWSDSTSDWKVIKNQPDFFSKSDIIKAKNQLLGKLEISRKTPMTLRKICYTFCNTYGAFKWKTNISDKVNMARTLLDEGSDDNFVIAIEILKSCERK